MMIPIRPLCTKIF